MLQKTLRLNQGINSSTVRWSEGFCMRLPLPMGATAVFETPAETPPASQSLPSPMSISCVFASILDSRVQGSVQGRIYCRPSDWAQETVRIRVQLEPATVRNVPSTVSCGALPSHLDHWASRVDGRLEWLLDDDSLWAVSRCQVPRPCSEGKPQKCMS